MLNIIRIKILTLLIDYLFQLKIINHALQKNHAIENLCFEKRNFKFKRYISYLFFEIQFDFFDGILNLSANYGNKMLNITVRNITCKYLTILAILKYANHCKNNILEITRREYQIKQIQYIYST